MSFFRSLTTALGITKVTSSNTDRILGLSDLLLVSLNEDPERKESVPPFYTLALSLSLSASLSPSHTLVHIHISSLPHLN